MPVLDPVGPSIGGAAPGQPGPSGPDLRRLSRPRPGARPEHVFGPLADLPIRVAERFAKSGLHVLTAKGIIETRQCDHGPASYGGFVRQGTEDRRQPLRMTERPERSYSRLPAQRVAVPGRHPTEGGDRARSRLAGIELAQRATGGFDHRRQAVGQGGHELVLEAPLPVTAGQLAGPAADFAGRVYKRPGQVVRLQRPHPGQGGEGAAPDLGGRVVETGASCDLVSSVARYDNGPAPGRGAGGGLRAGGHWR